MPHTLNMRRWLTILGPGAIIASLTIGAGELVFSSRGGAIFGYSILSVVWFVCLIKWGLLLAAARHIVVSGAHPFQRWVELPGPRGWLPATFVLLGILAFPLWVGFHAGTIGTLLAYLTGTGHLLAGAAHYVWGLIVLAGVMVLVWTGSYARLERWQIVIVCAMLACVGLSLVMLRPDLHQMVRGLIPFQPLAYPDWLARQGEFISRPVWVELTTYMGVIGGSGYDYLAYVTYVRDKQWGKAGGPVLDATELERLAAEPFHLHDARRWLRAPWLDCSISFFIVFFFSAVFVASGAVVLGPQHKVPADVNLLTFQAEFVHSTMPSLRSLYFVGALLAMLGTLYGTIEVAPAVFREWLWATSGTTDTNPASRRLHRLTTGCVGAGGASVLIICTLSSILSSTQGAVSRPVALTALLTPANLFTGVLACGIIAWLGIWSDYRYLPRPFRQPLALQWINGVGGGLLIAAGIKGYWDFSGGNLALLLATMIGTCAAGAAVSYAHSVDRSRRERQRR